MRRRYHVALVLAGAVAGVALFLWWSNVRIAAWCATHGRDPCIFPADSLVLGVPAAAVAGALLARLLLWAGQQLDADAERR